RLVEADTAADTERLGYVDLHVVDEVAVPDRLEQSVGEPERQDVLSGLLAQEVVDTKDLALIEGLVLRRVQRECAAQVGAEGFLHDDARAAYEAGFGECADDRQSCARRNAQVMQSVGLTAEFGLGSGHSKSEIMRSRALRHVAQPTREGAPLVLVDVDATELLT